MSRIDRAVRRASQWLAAGETLVASATGTEADGRRRAVVLVTDSRVILAWSRSTTCSHAPLDDVEVGLAGPGSLLELRGPGGVDITLRDVPADDAQQVASLVSEHRPRIEIAHAEHVPHVRIIEG